MPNLTRHTIEFRYQDNGQLYSTQILVTPEELERVKKFFVTLLEENYIVAADGTDPDEIDYIVFQRSDKPQTFEQLRQDIEGGDALKSYAETLGIEL
jgi:hypothetical protein